MKVILQKDVKDLGKKDDIVDVSDGYGKNYLMPRGLAKLATEGNINDAKNKQQAKIEKEKRELENAQKAAKELDGKKVTVAVKAGENGKLFGAVSTKDIADGLSKIGIEIDKRKIVIDEPMKATGSYKATVKVYPGISANIDVEVVAE